MINLLPQSNLRELRAARHNSVLLSYTIAAAIIAVIILFVYVTMFVLMRSTENTNTELSTQSQRKIAQLRAVETETKAYSANLKLAKSLFASRASYTSALHNLAQALPKGVVVQSLDLNPETIGQPTTLAFLATSTPVALEIKQSLEDAGLASDITISSLAEGGESANPAYPVDITLNLTLQPALYTPEESDE